MKPFACLVVIIPLVFCRPSAAQDNNIKINLSSLVLKNFNFQYERGILPHISVALGFRFMPTGSIPFQGTIENTFKNANFDFRNLSVGNIAITPEVRFYLGPRPQRGFYIAPYLRYSHFNFTVPVNYTYGDANTQTEAVFDGKTNAFSGGVMIGVQHVFGHVLLDIWILGGNYGGGSGTGNYVPAQPLTSDQQQGLQQAINNVNIKPFNFSGTVSANGAVVHSNGPWAGIRALGINLGVRF